MAEKLKREFIELLEKDVEFRYTVAGYLGLSEILKRLDRHESHILEILKRLDRLEENQNRLWENVNRLWEEVRALREGQERLWESVRRLEAGQERLWKYVKSGFRELREMLGVTFEATARAFIEVLLDEMGYPDARVDVKHFAVDGKVVDIDAFCEEPLVVGEITNYIGTREQAESEVEKLRSRVSMVEERYGRRALLVLLLVGSVPEEIGSYLRELAGRNGIRLVLGREIRETLEL
ncbi:MAG: hypothetical protein QXO17_06890 [Nitrososphaerota archaeon]